MSSPEGYNPELPENINARNEAGEINQMVDKDLLTRQEAGDFDYENEFEIPNALLSKPPKISERLRQQVIAKFPPESFEPESIDGTVIHGTYLHSIRPMWKGEGIFRTFFAGHGDPVPPYNNPDKGLFSIEGDFTLLDDRGFNYIDKEYGQNERSSGYMGFPFPIFLVVGRSRLQGTRRHHLMFNVMVGLQEKSENGYNVRKISAVVVTKDKRNLVESKNSKSE
ncbi:MAG: hypothetical protein Athens101428_484, partial [Candidatus Berkelbacteria bacterium Athens1014_28]